MSWIAFELLWLGLGWLGVAFFREHTREKEFNAEVLSGGGIVVTLLFSVLLCILLYQKIILPVALWLLLPIIFMGIVGGLEDFKKIPINASLILQVIATYIAFYTLRVSIPIPLLIKLPLWSILSFIILGILFVSASLKRMDKSDGFAALQSLWVLSTMGAAFYAFGLYDLCILLFGLSGILSGFLIWNWPGSKITLGKSGTLFLGSLIALLALYSYQWCQVPLEIWIILMSPFLVDSALTAIRQGFAWIIRSKPSEELSSLHAYERLGALGWSSFQLLLGLIVLDGVLTGIAFCAYKLPELLMPLTLGALGLVGGLYGLVEWRKPMYQGWYSPLAFKKHLSLEGADHL